MNLGRPGGSDDRPRRSSGRRADAARRNASTSRNPLLAADPEDPALDLSLRPRRERRADPLDALDARAPREAGGEQHKYRRHPGAADKGNAGAARGPIGISHVLFLLVGLALGVALLVSLQHFYAVAGRARKEPAESPPPVAAALVPRPASPPPIRRATTPVEAVKLMMSAAKAGDTATAYAQWDIAPDDFATIKRGQEMTVADIVSNAARHPELVLPDKHTYRVLSQSASETHVGEYDGELCLQLFSLRQRGPYWKLYNASAP